MAVTTKQIAELAGVSRGTVDRALHNRGRVNPEVAARIKKIADELGYQPHSVAQQLALSGKTFKFGVYMQSAETPTMKLVLDGVKRATEELKPLGVSVHLLTHPNFDSGAIMSAIDEMIAEGCQAIAFTPTMDSEVIERVNQLEREGIPVVFFNRDAPESDRLCYVGMNNYKGGQVAGYLLGNILGGVGKVLPITGHLTNYAHYNRGRGFIEVLKSDFPNIDIMQIQGCFDNDDYAYQIAKLAFESNDDITGIFIAANGTQGVVTALRELGVNKKIKVVTYDLNEPNRQALADGDLSIVLDQNPQRQGYRSLMMLYNYVAKNQAPEDRFDYCELSVFTKYNLDD